MNFLILPRVFSFLFGLALGSFLNVCIYRIPLGKSIVRPPSSCPHCGERIKFYDNIPLLSYIILRGRCRHCRVPLSWHYPVVEALGGLLSLSLFIRYGLSYQYLAFLLFVASLITISFIDLDHQIIPDLISIPCMVAGWSIVTLADLFRSAPSPPPASSFFVLYDLSWLDSLAGIIAGGGSLYLVAVFFKLLTGKEGMGGGDIKLLAMIGAWLGWKPLLPVVMIASITGTVVGATALLVAGKGLRVRIPFGPFLSVGALIYFFFGHQLKIWYLGLVL